MNKISDLLKNAQEINTTKVLQNIDGDIWFDSKTTTVVFLPFFIDQNAMVLTEKAEKAYNYNQAIEKTYLVAGSVRLNPNEKPESALFRGLEEVYGININSNYTFNIKGPMYVSPESNQKIYYSVVFLHEDNYQQQKDKKMIKINIRNIKNIMVSDFITHAILLDFRSQLGI